MTFSVKGSKGPYYWSASIGTITPSGDGTSAILKPPVNTGAAVAGDAYKRARIGINPGTCNPGAFVCYSYSCNDVFIRDFGFASCCPSFTINTSIGPPCLTEVFCGNGANFSGSTGEFDGPALDLRTAPMIAGGCNPCGTAFRVPGTVTVTDALGQSATAVVTA